MSLTAFLCDLSLRAMRAKTPTPGERAWRGVLALASLGYGAAARLRNAAYTHGVLPVHRLPCRVLCVGNLTVGGTGKTPAVMTLARRLVEAGSKVAVLLRGYGGTEGAVRVVSDGRQVLLDWRRAGDEAILLAQRLPGVPVVIGGDRVAAGRLLLGKFGPDTILLDDGFQHRRLHRDLDLVLLDATDPFGGDRLLPRGRLREPIASLRRAHAVLVTRTDQVEDQEALRRRLEISAPGIPLAWTIHNASRVTDLCSGREQPPASLRGTTVFAVSGIANPESFEWTLRRLGATVAGGLAFSDHHPFTRDDRTRMLREARRAGATCIVTTEKDAVRLAGEPPADFPVLALGIDLRFIQGAEAVERLLGIPAGEGARG